LAGGAVGGGDFEGAVGKQLGGVAPVVQAGVVEAAQQGEVVDVGAAAVVPPFDVMGVAPRRGAVAVGESAAPVPHHQSDERGAWACGITPST